MTVSTRQALRRLQAQALPLAAAAEEDAKSVDSRIRVLSAILAESALDEPAPTRGFELLVVPTDSRQSRLARPKRSRTRWLSIAVTAVIVAAAAITVPLLSQSTAYAQTPPMLTYTPLTSNQSPANLLNTLADRAAAQTAQQPTLPYFYSSFRDWSLSTTQTVDGDTLSKEIVDSTYENWQSEDGSYRSVVTKAGQAPIITDLAKPAQTEYDNLPSDLEALEKALRYSHVNDYGPGTMVGAVSDAWSANRRLSPAVRAGLLRVLASQPGLQILGTTTDRAGRPGIAIAADITADYHERRILIIDQRTGELLSYEVVMLTPDILPVDPPATIQYLIWLKTGYVANDTTTP